MSEEVKELLDKLGSMEDAPLIWINQRVENLITENNQLRKRIDKTVQAIDELLIYSDFNDTTNGFGNVKEELKFYLSDCKTMTEFKARDLLKGDKE